MFVGVFPAVHRWNSTALPSQFLYMIYIIRNKNDRWKTKFLYMMVKCFFFWWLDSDQSPTRSAHQSQMCLVFGRKEKLFRRDLLVLLNVFISKNYNNKHETMITLICDEDLYKLWCHIIFNSFLTYHILHSNYYIWKVIRHRRLANVVQLWNNLKLFSLI